LGRVGKDNYKVPSKDELEGKGRKRQKHITYDSDLDNLVCDYAKKLSVSQAQVITEMMRVGIVQFEINHGFRLAESDNKRDANLAEQLNETYRKITEQKKAESASKANEIAKAYEKRIIHGIDDSEWTQQYG